MFQQPETDPLAGGQEAFNSAAAWVTEVYDSFSVYVRSLTLKEVLINAAVSAAFVMLVLLALWVVAWLGGKPKDSMEPGARRFPAPLTLHLLGVVIVAFAAYVLLRIWGLDLFQWLGGEQGAAAYQTAVNFTLTALIALAIWESANRLVSRSILREAERAEEPRRAAQLRSLAPLVGGAVRALVAAFAVLLIVSQFGVEIAPLLAGAGVVSIAIGFGAQTLVKDYLTGFSLILEDIAAVGDIVKIGDSSGVVERMTLRTIRLRDFDGTLHVIPYSEAQTVHNMTKTFSYYVFDVSVSYESDIDKALRVLREVGDEMRADPRFGPLMIDELEVYGVDKLADSAVMLKARVKTFPAQQWTVGREFNRRIKLAFDAQGVDIPFPQLRVTLEPGGGSVA